MVLMPFSNGLIVSTIAASTNCHQHRDAKLTTWFTPHNNESLKQCSFWWSRQHL